MWAASENHLSVCRRKPDMLENIWYAACPEEEKNATVANSKMRCSFPPLPLFRQVWMRSTDSGWCVILTGWIRTQDCFASLFIKWNLVRSPCHFHVGTKREWWWLALERSSSMTACACFNVCLCLCANIRGVSRCRLDSEDQWVISQEEEKANLLL